MEPINYTLGGQSPLQAFQGALSLGTQIQEQRAAVLKAQLAQQQAEAEAKRQADIAAAFERLKQPGATAKDYMDLAMVLPKDESEALRESFKTLQVAEQQAALSDTSQVFAAFKAGRIDIAVQLIRAQAQAERASGNEQGAKLAEAWANMAESGVGGASAVENLFGYTLAQMPGGDKAIEGALKLNVDLRLAQEHPVLMQQKQAELSKAKSDAEKATIEAKYAELIKKADIEKMGADLGLTKVTIDKVIAETKKLGVETSKILAEIAALQQGGGGLTPEKQFEKEEALRKEYTARVQAFTKMRTTYDTIKASSADQTGAGDVALVFGFMRILDPDSVVRESEFANAQDTAGLLTKLKTVAKKVENGEFLSVEQRADFARLAGEYMKASEAHEQRVRSDLGIVVRNYGLNPSNVFGETITQGSPTAGAVIQPKPPATDLAALRAFIKANNPSTTLDVANMTEDAIAKVFKNGYAAFKAQNATRVEEVDY